MKKITNTLNFLSFLLLLSLLVACNPTNDIFFSNPTEHSSSTVEITETSETANAYKDEPVQIKGEVLVTSQLIIDVYYFEIFAFLEDLTGFVQRDFDYEQPRDSQTIGSFTVLGDNTLSFTLNLPTEPNSPHNDVDNNDKDDLGVQIWQAVMKANYLEDPFLSKDETRGWSSNYTSAKIDSENKNEIVGGLVLIWAPDDHQEFSRGYGNDGLLFTDDDPVGSVPSGYTLVNLDHEPFTFHKEHTLSLELHEGDIEVIDYTSLSWTEAFENLHNKISEEYPFTELKNIEWDHLYEEYYPQIEAAQIEDDEKSYYLALRDYSWSIPDGHVKLSFGDIGMQMFRTQTNGGYGFAIIGLDDGRKITHVLLEDGPTAKAGMQWGAEILEWNGLPIDDAITQVIPWSMPFSTQEPLLIQQYRYLLRAPIGTEAIVKFKNPDMTTYLTETLTAISERETFLATSFYADIDPANLPIESKILPNGYGYIKISTFLADINLIIRMWGWAIEKMIENNVPAIIIDLRNNFGGASLGTFLSRYFVTDTIDVSRLYFYSERSDDFETFGSPNSIEPDSDLVYDGQLAVLINPACKSACEEFAYVLGLLPQTRIFGHYGSPGTFGEIARGQYELPGGYSFQIPTGMFLDMDGNIILEGTGVSPDMYVPVTEETVRANYVENEDVVLNYAIEVLNQPLGAGIIPEYSPIVVSRNEAQSALQAKTKWIEEYAQETYSEDELSKAGHTYTYTISLPNSRKLIWAYPWCAKNLEILNENWSNIRFDQHINNRITRTFQGMQQICGAGVHHASVGWQR